MTTSNSTICPPCPAADWRIASASTPDVMYTLGVGALSKRRPLPPRRTEVEPAGSDDSLDAGGALHLHDRGGCGRRRAAAGQAGVVPVAAGFRPPPGGASGDAQRRRRSRWRQDGHITSPRGARRCPIAAAELG